MDKKKVIVMAQMDNKIDHTFESANRIYDSKYCCPTIPTICGGSSTKGDKEMEEKFIGIRQATKDGFLKMEIGGVADLLYPSSKSRRGRIQGEGKICPTIATSNGMCKVMDRAMVEKTIGKTRVEDFLVDDYGIFKLSPRELGRLQGVTDDDITKMMAVNSNTQCMKQFGNSICVPMLMAVFSQLNIKGVKPWNECTDQENNERVLKDIIK